MFVVIPMMTEMRNILATNLGGYCCHGALAYLHKICETRNTKQETRNILDGHQRVLDIENIKYMDNATL